MYLPHIDVCERPDEIVILVEIPGVDREDVSLGWKDQVLTISGRKKRRSIETNVHYLCAERDYGPFRREISIGIPIDHRKARAELRNGVMKICLPKTQGNETGIRIPID